MLPMTVAPLGVEPAGVDRGGQSRARRRPHGAAAAPARRPRKSPRPDDLHRVGTVAIIRQMAKGPNGMRVLVEGVARARAEFLQTEKGFLTALLKPLPESTERSIDIDARVRRLQELVDRALSLATGLSPEVKTLVMSLDDPLRIAYLLASLLDMKAEDKQRLLEENSLSIKLDAVSMVLSREIEVLELKGQIESRAEKEMTDAQRQYVLRQQLKAIQTELGEGDGEAAELRKRVTEPGSPRSVAAIAMREVDRLERMTPASPEYQMIRTYLDWVLDVPWDRRPRTGSIRSKRGACSTRTLRSRQGQGRIVEYLRCRSCGTRSSQRRRHAAVPSTSPGGDRRAAPREQPRKGPSVHEGADSLLRRPAGRRQDLARPVDRAIDEPEVRAHLARRRARRSGDSRASPDLHRLAAGAAGAGAEDGRIVEPGVDARRDRQDLGRRPGRSGRGAARSARPGAEPRLPRSLHRDPDRSVAGAVHRDREPARHHPSGAARSHGAHLAQRLHRRGQGPHRAHVPDSASARRTRAQARSDRDHRRGAAPHHHRIHARSRRAHARTANRHDGAQGRGAGRDRRAHTSRRSMRRRCRTISGPSRFRSEMAFRTSRPGVATGVAWTEAGGDVLFIEAVLLPGGAGHLTLTGQLGSVMQESARAALSHVRQQAAALGIERETLTKHDLHVHVPAGAIPKDGPSAGVTMATAIVSAARGEPVRADVAMTGEITLSGLVLPVGGIREKALAARRYGIKTFVLPAMNEQDLVGAARRKCATK